ncbi:unnamed protein product [Cyprideis torosa]|uniref:Uncharacterized protein n=1 Tax=Cyprideis torosa TaxID=163714 RepID=A0A7R8WJU0_9CRUS|nr:unnamed protein product [Cyprideis torosa]CAG0902424.1 unnamed protein product [Cyprideis torosa]
MDYKALSQAAELKTGGLSVSTHLSSHPTEPGIYEEGILFSTYCLNENFGDALKLWNTVFLDPKLEDLQRLSTLLKMGLADLVNGVPFRGHLYAMRHAGKALSPVGQISERKKETSEETD